MVNILWLLSHQSPSSAPESLVCAVIVILGATLALENGPPNDPLFIMTSCPIPGASCIIVPSVQDELLVALKLPNALFGTVSRSRCVPSVFCSLALMYSQATSCIALNTLSWTLQALGSSSGRSVKVSMTAARMSRYSGFEVSSVRQNRTMKGMNGAVKIALRGISDLYSCVVHVGWLTIAYKSPAQSFPRFSR